MAKDTACRCRKGKQPEHFIKGDQECKVCRQNLRSEHEKKYREINKQKSTENQKKRHRILGVREIENLLVKEQNLSAEQVTEEMIKVKRKRLVVQILKEEISEYKAQSGSK